MAGSGATLEAMPSQRRDRPANANLLGKFVVDLAPGATDETDPDEGKDPTAVDLDRSEATEPARCAEA